jgi:hypothetical protein
MAVLKVGFVGIRSDRLDETVALFRDVMGVPVLGRPMISWGGAVMSAIPPNHR